MTLMKKTRLSKITTEKIKEIFKNKHGLIYNYDKVMYKSMHSKVIITCNFHGDFLQEPNQHREGHGCKKCAVLIQKNKQKDTTEGFIAKAKNINGEHYDYSKTIYGKNAHEKVTIICPYHGEFTQSPNAHLAGRKCKLCTRGSGWTRSGWVRSCKDKTAKLYIVKCYNEEEVFYKIGITNQDSVDLRFKYKSLMPYQYEILKIIEDKDNPVNIYNLERSLHKLHGKLKYQPKIYFGGFSECFTKLLI